MRAVTIAAVCLLGTLVLTPALAGDRPATNLGRAKLFLAAADYRHAIDACLKEVAEAPSARSYTALTYVYQALDGYLERLAKQDHWMQVEHLYLNLSFDGPRDLTDPPDVLPRIAKELMQQSAQRQSDINAAMANRLDKAAVDALWQQQTVWRKAHPDDWFHGMPPEWTW